MSSILFVLFATGVFTGALLHFAGMILGPAPDGPALKWHPWRHTPIAALAAVLVVIGFWVPGPLIELVRGAAAVVTGGAR